MEGKGREAQEREREWGQGQEHARQCKPEDKLLNTGNRFMTSRGVYVERGDG